MVVTIILEMARIDLILFFSKLRFSSPFQWARFVAFIV